MMTVSLMKLSMKNVKTHDSVLKDCNNTESYQLRGLEVIQFN